MTDLTRQDDRLEEHLRTTLHAVASRSTGGRSAGAASAVPSPWARVRWR
jgi:hypothetical protein